MSDPWYLFDKETVEDRDDREAREQVIADIQAAEKAAVDACTAILVAAAKYDGYGETTAQHSLTHIAVMATAEGNQLFRHADRRSERKRMT